MSGKNFKRSDGGGLGGHGSWHSKHLIAARALVSRDWEAPNAIRHARHMAHAGATTDEIAAMLGWQVCRATVLRRLRKYNIRTRNPSNRRHRGLETGIPHANSISMASFRPRIFEGAE